MTLPPLAAEQIFRIGNFPVTNTLVNAGIATLLFAVFAFFLNIGIKKYYSKDRAPKGLLNFFESILEVFLSQIDAVTKDRKKTAKFLPFVPILINVNSRSISGYLLKCLVPLFRYKTA